MYTKIPPPMIWTSDILEEAQRLTATNSTTEIAEVLGVKPCTLRKALSDYGIPSARRLRQLKDRKLARKFYACGWSINEIMEHLGRCRSFVKASIGYQTALWPDKYYRVPPKPMRIVHWQPRRSARPYVQLVLFPELYTKAKAA